jgi:hypothetical protein
MAGAEIYIKWQILYLFVFQYSPEMFVTLSSFSRGTTVSRV